MDRSEQTISKLAAHKVLWSRLFAQRSTLKRTLPRDTERKGCSPVGQGRCCECSDQQKGCNYESSGFLHVTPLGASGTCGNYTKKLEALSFYFCVVGIPTNQGRSSWFRNRNGQAFSKSHWLDGRSNRVSRSRGTRAARIAASTKRERCDR